MQQLVGIDASPMNTSTEAPPSRNTEIDDLALLFWEQAGCPAGREREFWLKAEDEIVNKRNAAHDEDADEG